MGGLEDEEEGANALVSGATALSRNNERDGAFLMVAGSSDKSLIPRVATAKSDK